VPAAADAAAAAPVEQPPAETQETATEESQ